ncbi:MAG: MFS transporter, partial [Nanoarchaeota archaeon]|nr:MFS transporter [Nanoarchaeota archaeon]
LRTFAIALINIFVPIYLLKLGFSLKIVLWFFTVLSLTHGTMSFLGAKISSKIGHKHLILLSVPFLIIYYFLLYSINFVLSIGIPLLVIPIFGGISDAFFWTGHHVHFAESADKKKTGKELGIIKILIGISTAIGPIIGGLLLTSFNFNIVFMLVCVILVLSFIPLLMTEDKSEPFKISFNKSNRIFKLKDIIGHVGFGIESSIYQVIWPIFIFFMILNQGFTALGTVSSLSLLFSIMMTYLIASNIDKRPNLLNDLGAVINGIIWIIKTVVKTGFQVIIIDSMSGLSRTTQNISFNKICYDKARKSKIVEYITIREFCINMAHAATYFILSFIIINTNYFIAFLIGAAGSFMFLIYRA